MPSCFDRKSYSHNSNKCSQFQKIIDQKEQRNQGLPNIGNICFLNSAIQFLYSSTGFREFLLKNNIEVQSLQYNLKKIFQCISDEKSSSQKEIILERITKQLYSMDFSYKFNHQQDCFQLILMIINHLEEKFPKFQQLFRLYYKYVCQKCSKSQKRSEYMIRNQIIFCQECSGIMKICFIKKPSYIIFYGFKKAQNTYQVMTVLQQELKYNLIAKVLYSGNGQWGHYKSIRLKNVDRYDGQYYVFDDSRVYPEKYNSSYTQSKSPFLSLYQLRIQNQQLIDNRVKTLSSQEFNSSLNDDKNINQMARTISYDKRSQKFPIIQQIEKSQTKQKFIQYFLNQNVDQILDQSLRAVYNIQSLRKKIQLIPKQRHNVVNLFQIYLKNLNQKKTPKSNQHYLCQIAKHLINDQSQQFYNQLDIYYKLHIAHKKQKKQNISQLKILFFISIINFICMLSTQIADSFKCQYQNYSKQCHQEKKIDQFFIIRQAQIYCSKQAINQKYFSFLRKPQYIIIIQRKNSKNLKLNFKQNQKQVAYNQRSCIEISKGKQPIFIKILEIYKLEVKLYISDGGILKNLQVDENISIRELLQRFGQNLRKYNQYNLYNQYNQFVFLVAIHQKPIQNNNLDQKLSKYQYLWSKNGNKKFSLPISSYLKLSIRQIN